MRRLFTAPRRNAATALMLAAMAAPALAERALAAPGDNEIRIGNTMPYTGPASAYGVIGKVMAAYFDKVNAEGGIKGRKINFISYDDAYNPTKTMEATRKLVEEDNVLFILASLGTNTSQAVHPYLNAKKIPQLFVASGATMWDQPREFPWTMGFLPSYQTEAHIYSQYLLENHPRSKIAVLYQDDGFGKDYLKGLKDGLGGKIPIVAEAPYKVTDTSIDAQIAKLKASGADIFMQFTTPKFAAMAIKRNAELGWKPLHFLASVSESVSAVMAPAGLENAEGIMSAMYRLEGEDAAGRRPRGVPRMERLHGAICSERQQVERPGRLRLSERQAHYRGPEELRRRLLARKHHEAGPLDQGSADSDDGAGHPDQHQPVATTRRSSRCG